MDLGPWGGGGEGNLRPAACDAMMTMTMSSPQCRNHGLSGAGSHLPLERKAPSGLDPKQTHQSGCSACLFRHAFMNEGLAALHAQSQSSSPSRKPNRGPRGRDSRSHIGFASRARSLAALSQPWPFLWWPAARRVPSYPSRRHSSSAATTCYTMEVSTIPGQSHPGLGSAGSINAVPPAGRARHSLGLVDSSAQASRAILAPALRKSQTCAPCRIRLRVMLAASLDDTKDRTSTIFSPVGKLPTIMGPREPSPVPARKGAALRGGRSR